jgi:hypothetical protein
MRRSDPHRSAPGNQPPAGSARRAADRQSRAPPFFFAVFVFVLLTVFGASLALPVVVSFHFFSSREKESTNDPGRRRKRLSDWAAFSERSKNVVAVSRCVSFGFFAVVSHRFTRFKFFCNASAGAIFGVPSFRIVSPGIRVFGCGFPDHNLS